MVRRHSPSRLGRKSIPARLWESPSDEELREIELDENVQRLDLDSYETSKERLRELETTAASATVSRGKRGPAGEKYPALQGKDWRRGAAIDAAEQLDEMHVPV